MELERGGSRERQREESKKKLFRLLIRWIPLTLIHLSPLLTQRGAHSSSHQRYSEEPECGVKRAFTLWRHKNTTMLLNQVKIFLSSYFSFHFSCTHSSPSSSSGIVQHFGYYLYAIIYIAFFHSSLFARTLLSLTHSLILTCILQEQASEQRRETYTIFMSSWMNWIEGSDGRKLKGFLNRYSKKTWRR